MELVDKDKLNVALACRLLGHCRQAFYQTKSDIINKLDRERQVVDSVKEIRCEDPGIGGLKLWHMMQGIYGRNNVMGRDSFLAMLRRNGLMLPPPKPRHTTNSNHRYHKWKNRIKEYIPLSANRLWVADITYVVTAEGILYLHLITDAYSHMIVGYILSDTLKAEASLQALEQAVAQAIDMAGQTHLLGLTHHSDRGVQYCCDAYIAKLQEHSIAVSMTESYNPTDNAVAERVNGIIKSELLYRVKQFESKQQAQEAIYNFIRFYNEKRPHMSIGYKTPIEVHFQSGEQVKMWKNKVYPKKDDMNK